MIKKKPQYKRIKNFKTWVSLFMVGGQVVDIHQNLNFVVVANCVFVWKKSYK